MDRDDMRDNIERATTACAGCGNAFGCMYPACVAGDIAADRQHVASVERRTGMSPALGMPYAASTAPTGDPYAVFADGYHEVQAAFVGDVPLCAGCLEFGTLCRPCRKARYDAKRAVTAAAERVENGKRLRVAALVLAMVLALGFAVQACGNRQCGATARWDAEGMTCTAR